MAVQYAETDISGSPFSPEAYNASLIQVSSLQDGIVGQPVTFQGTCVFRKLKVIFLIHRIYTCNLL